MRDRVPMEFEAKPQLLIEKELRTLSLKNCKGLAANEVLPLIASLLLSQRVIAVKTSLSKTFSLLK